MNSLPSVDVKTLAKVKVMLNQGGGDTAVLLRWVEDVLDVIGDTGFGQVTTYITHKKVTLIKTQKTYEATPPKTTPFE